MNEPIGKRLKSERERLRKSQDEFATLGGVKKRAQIYYEQDERCPDGHYFSAIAAAGADVAYILTGKQTDAYPVGQTAAHSVNETGQQDPLARQRQQIKTLVDKLDESGLKAVQEECEKVERIKALEREVAALRRRA